ncbi:hypothetical protein PI125_g20984 [Phytophthora idaei]|nr:hypothetical protein PI125_g20984 [Phytophthora idaei]
MIKFVLDYTRHGLPMPEYCESERMAADVFIKALPAPRPSVLRVLVGRR